MDTPHRSRGHPAPGWVPATLGYSGHRAGSLPHWGEASVPPPQGRSPLFWGAKRGASPQCGGSGASLAPPQPAWPRPRCGAWEGEQLELQTWAPAAGKEGRTGLPLQRKPGRESGRGERGWGAGTSPLQHPGGGLRIQQKGQSGSASLLPQFPPWSHPGQGGGCIPSTKHRVNPGGKALVQPH